MQNRYVGDIGDYSKFVLIKYLFKKKCGIIWYLYPNEGNADGKFRNYEGFDLKDDEIVEIMNKFSKTEEDKRSIKELENILGRNGFDLTYFNECIEEKTCESFFSNYRKRKAYRKEWFEKALEKVKNCEVVFADPDNGTQIKSCPTKGTKKSGKYIYLDEIDKVLESHKTVIIYQHFGRKKHTDLIEQKEQELRNLKQNFNFYALKFKRISTRAYLILSKNNLKDNIEKFCNRFQEEFELIKEL